MPEIITPTESVRLIELERVIEKGKTTFVEVGNALAEIRQSRLYRSSHGTFEAYFQDRLGLEKSHVKRLMDAARVIANIQTSPIGEVSPPANIEQTRPLAKLPAEQQPAAWEKAQEIAKDEGKPVTAKHVEAAVAEVMPPAVKTRPAPINYTPSDALNIWATAKSILERILQNDTQREDALNAASAYIQDRIQNNR